MNREKKLYPFWMALAGTSFLIVACSDLWLQTTPGKSMLIISLEFVAAIGFFLNALVHLRRPS
jgi:hypothetical protein